MTRTAKKKKSVERKVGGALLKKQNTDAEEFLERLSPKPLKEHMKNLGPTGSISLTDFYRDKVVDKLIEESVMELTGEGVEEE